MDKYARTAGQVTSSREDPLDDLHHGMENPLRGVAGTLDRGYSDLRCIRQRVRASFDAHPCRLRTIDEEMRRVRQRFNDAESDLTRNRRLPAHRTLLRRVQRQPPNLGELYVIEPNTPAVSTDIEAQAVMSFRVQRTVAGRAVDHVAPSTGRARVGVAIHQRITTVAWRAECAFAQRDLVPQYLRLQAPKVLHLSELEPDAATAAAGVQLQRSVAACQSRLVELDAEAYRARKTCRETSSHSSTPRAPGF